MFRSSCGAVSKMCDCKRDWFWIRPPLGKMKYLFKFIFCVEAKRGAEFRYSKRIASRIQR